MGLDEEKLNPAHGNLTKYQGRIEERTLGDSIDRAIFFSKLLAPVYFFYGFTSHEFLVRFDETISLWSNIWPRLIFNVIPTLLLSWFTKNSQLSNTKKLIFWSIGFATIFHIGAWIHVWPLALDGHPEILTYVHAANIFLFAFAYLVVTPPRSFIISFSVILTLILVVPLLLVAYAAGDAVIFRLTLNDCIFTITSAIFISITIDRLRSRLAFLELQREEAAKMYLSPVVSKAIFEGKKELLAERKQKGFIVSMDIRSSTPLQNEYRDDWLKFRKAYFREVSIIIAKYRGYLQKTVGDRHVFSFGVVDPDIDLSDIEGIETELKFAEERRLRGVSDRAFGCLNEIFEKVVTLGPQFIPQTTIRIGAGIDKGEVVCGVQGDEDTGLEFDINGASVNLSDRLEAFGKSISHLFNQDESILIVSPFASDYLSEEALRHYHRVSLDDPRVKSGIRDFPGVRWILARTWPHAKALKQTA
jgi:class 3 adenylate cyclase